MTNRPDYRAATDEVLLRHFHESTEEAGEPDMEAIVAELERRGLDV